MHGDVGIAKLAEFWSHAGGPVCRNGHDDVGGSRAGDQLIESIDSAKDRDRIGLGMDCEMTATRLEARGPCMTGIDEPDDRQPAPWLGAHGSDQPPCVSPGAQEHDAAFSRDRAPGCCVCDNIHESPPIPRRRYGSRPRLGRLGPEGLDRGSYHPGLARDSFLQALRSAGPTLKSELFRKVGISRPRRTPSEVD